MSKAAFVYLQLFSNIYVGVNDEFACWQTPQADTSVFGRAAGGCAASVFLSFLAPALWRFVNVQIP